MRRWMAGLGCALAAFGTMGLTAADRTPFDWLIGNWVGEGGGAQLGQGGFSFAPEAGGIVIVRRNFAEYPAQNGRPASRHDDLMVIEGRGADVTARYWDSEGQTIHYRVSSPEPGVVVFVSDDPAGARFRLTYRRTAAGLAGSFDVAPPPARDRFEPYLAWTATKAR